MSDHEKEFQIEEQIIYVKSASYGVMTIAIEVL